MRKGKKEKQKKPKNIHSRGAREKLPTTKGIPLSFLRGIGIAFAITCIIFIGFGILLTYTSLSEETLPMVSLVCTALSAAAAGYDWAACKKKKGLLWGALAGLVYGVVLYLVTSLAADSFALALSGVMTWIVAAVGGMIGGILGVNRK